MFKLVSQNPSFPVILFYKYHSLNSIILQSATRKGSDPFREFCHSKENLLYCIQEKNVRFAQNGNTASEIWNHPARERARILFNKIHKRTK